MILAIVVTYFPQEELLRSNVNAFIDFIDKVLIWENTPPDQRNKYRFIDHEKAEYCGDSVNSISHALNYAWKYAKTGGYDHLLTMDQDSCFVDFPNYIKRTVLNKDAPRGLFTPSINELKTEGSRNFEEIEKPITSGMLIPVTLIDKIGGWNEDFKIDGVDDEFCLRAHSLGIKAFAVKDAKMQHCLGEPVKRTFLGHTITLSNYSPTRLHSIYRNKIILARKYPQFVYIQDDLKSWLRNIIWILLFEGNKTQKFLSILRGCFDGLTKRV